MHQLCIMINVMLFINIESVVNFRLETLENYQNLNSQTLQNGITVERLVNVFIARVMI